MMATYFVYVSDRGNIFMAEVAALLVSALTDMGYDTVFPAPGLPEPGNGRVNLVVAPHEFFPLQRGYSESELLKAAEASVAVGVEQPGTEWFELGTHYASVGPAVLDISTYAVAELRDRGLDPMHLQLGYHESWDRWGGDPDRWRGTDLLFLGALTPRRERILSEAAPLLWNFETDLRLFEVSSGAMDRPRGNFAVSTEKHDLLASSRVLLNIHQGDVPYLEWVRVLEALANGCLVISEQCSDYGPLTPGKHLIAAPPDLLAAYAASVLTDEPFRAEMAAEAHNFLRSKLELTALLEPICAKVESAVLNSTGPGPALPFRPAPPSPAPPPRPLVDALTSELRAQVRVKELLDSETDLVRHVESLQARIRYGDPDHFETFTTRAWEQFDPQVSVVITCYNYARYVVQAIESVMTSTGVAAELVVVDDHSDDESVQAVKQTMGTTSWFPMMLISRAANGGLCRARNLGFASARSELVFVLDADNMIYPTSLAKLSGALDRAPDAAFSYGIVSKVGAPQLLSHIPWDVPRLCTANYIDAMALIKRSVLDDIGGYGSDFSHGWEDYDLWLRMAANGLRGEFVPQIVGSYRVHAASMLRTVDLDIAPLQEDLRRRYPYLPWDTS